MSDLQEQVAIARLGSEVKSGPSSRNKRLQGHNPPNQSITSISISNFKVSNREPGGDFLSPILPLQGVSRAAE